MPGGRVHNWNTGKKEDLLENQGISWNTETDLLECQLLIRTPDPELAHDEAQLHGQVGEELPHHQGLGQGRLLLLLDLQLATLALLPLLLAEGVVLVDAEQGLDPAHQVVTVVLKAQRN